MRNINRIIIHCSATPASREISADQIDRWHRARGFKSIGYHFVIGLDGSVSPGRDIALPGAHCKGYNSNSIGICYIGGIDCDGNPVDTRTPAQRKALVSLLRQLLRQFPGATVHGHNELTCSRTSLSPCSAQCTTCRFARKACPSFNVKTDPEICAVLSSLSL